MKKFITYTLLILSFTFAAEAREVVKFKNDSVVKGEIMEYNPTGQIKIQSEDGRVVIFDAKDIVKIDTDKENSDGEYLIFSKHYNNVPKKNLAHKGYRGFVDYTPLTATFINNGIAGNITTTHGYQFNHNHFAGIGVGFHINLGDQGLGVAIPVYAAYKGNCGEKLAQLTYGARLGVTYADYGNFNSDTSIHNGTATLAYFNASIGLRLGFSRYFAINITPEADLFTGRYSIAGVGLRIGVEF